MYVLTTIAKPPRQTAPTATIITQLRTLRTMTPAQARSTIQLVIPDSTDVHFMEDTTNPELLTRDVASPTFPVENTDQTGILDSISMVKLTVQDLLS